LKVLSLTPYPGLIYVCETFKELQKIHKKLTGGKVANNGACGKTYQLEKDGEVAYLVWGDKPAALIHELTHCALYTFEHIGSDPRECNGEPFCYLLDRLIEEAGVTCT